MAFLQSDSRMVLCAFLVFRGVLVLYRTVKRLPQVCGEGYPELESCGCYLSPGSGLDSDSVLEFPASFLHPSVPSL
jgi:hypothetical protein